MRLRSHHLICLFLLLSTLRLAEGSMLPVGDRDRDSRCIGVLLCQNRDGVWTEVTLLDSGSRWTGSNALILVRHLRGKTAAQRMTIDRLGARGAERDASLPSQTAANLPETAHVLNQAAAQAALIEAVNARA